MLVMTLTTGTMICLLYTSSLDGPLYLHNHNRGKTDSYQRVVAGIAKAREELGEGRVSALMTTSEYSLGFPREIIDAYRENGFHSIFIRALNPYGLAKDNADWTCLLYTSIQAFVTSDIQSITASELSDLRLSIDEIIQPYITMSQVYCQFFRRQIVIFIFNMLNSF